VGAGPALFVVQVGGGAAIEAVSTGTGDLFNGFGVSGIPLFKVNQAGTGTFTGSTSTLTIGDVGCGVGDSGDGSAGFQVSGNSENLPLDCIHYNLLGDGVNTFINSTTNGRIKFRNGNLDEVIVGRCGFPAITPCMGINTTMPDTTLSVNGDADKPGGGSWGTFSDGRLKNIYGGFHSGLKQVLQLNPIRYQYKEENPLGIHDSEEHVGLVAQEVQKVIPEAVTTNNKGYLLVNNDPILWSMLNAIKEQQRQISAQQKQLRVQAAELAKLKARLEGPSAQPAPR
jgi:hypothetical protein